MILYYILLWFTSLLTAVFSFLPTVTALPTILGVDVDAQLTNTVGMIYGISSAFWVIGDLFKAFLFLMGYYVMMMVLRFFLGHRAPGNIH